MNYKQLIKDLRKLKYKQCKDFSLLCHTCMANAAIEVVILEVKIEEHNQKTLAKMKGSKEEKEYKKIVRGMLK